MTRHFIGAVGASLLLAFCFGTNAEARTALTGPTTYYYNFNSGSDASGSGTATAPFKSPCGAWSYLAANIDLNSQNVTITWPPAAGASASRVTCDLQAYGKLPGQTGSPWQVVIQGDPNCNEMLPYTSTNCNPAAVAGTYVWAPAYAGPLGRVNAITAGWGAVFRVTGYDFEMLDAMAGGTQVWGSDDMLNFSNAEIWLSNVVLGFTVAPHNMISVQHHGRLFVDGPIWVKGASSSATAGAISKSSATFMVSGIRGTIMPGMGIFGAGYPISSAAQVVSVSGQLITASIPPTDDGTNVALTFSSGAQAVIGVGQQSYAMITGPKNYVISSGVPNVTWGWLFADEMGCINWWGPYVTQAETANWQNAALTVGSNVATVGNPAWFLAGFLVWSRYFPPGTTVTNISGNTVTFSNPATASASAEPILIGAKAISMGPAMTAWLQSAINAGGTGSAQFPGTPPTITEGPAVGALWTSTLQ